MDKTHPASYMTHQESFIEKDTIHFSGMLSEYNECHFLTSHGNLGDELIFAGTREMLRKIGMPFKEMPLHEAVGGKLALISGGGAWCRTWDKVMMERLPEIEAKYDRVIVLPSSYQMTPNIDATIRASNKTTFCAREIVSYNLIRHYHQGKSLFHDMAFHYNFAQHKKITGNGNGAGDRVLNSYRMDDERIAANLLPTNNCDTSRMKYTMEEWLGHLGEYDIIKTDRAHVMIAAAMLGKMVLYRPSNYHKVPAIAEFSLKGLPVYLSH